MFSAVNDHVNGICAVVVAGTTRDSLDITHNLDGGYQPQTVTSDTSSPADRVVGIFGRLGYNSSAS